MCYKNDKISSFFCFSIMLMTMSELFEAILPAQFGLVDEIFTVIALIYIASRLLLGYSVNKIGKIVVAAVSLMIFCGLLGNIFFSTQKTIFSALVDVFLFMKIYVCLMFSLMAFKGNRIKAIYHFWLVFSKWWLCILASLTMLDAIFNGWGNRYSFFCGYYGTLSWWVLLLFFVVYSDKKCNRLLYFICTAVVIIKNESDLGVLGLCLVVVIYFFVEKSKKLRWYQFAVMLTASIWIGWNEISGYLMNSNAPRYLMLYYGFITANTYFPLGSGFATYASAQAAKNYSILYYKYGFDKIWGMTKNNISFLMDSYYPIVIGQTGYIGTAVFVLLMYFLMKEVVLGTKDKYFRCSALLAVSTWMAAGLGFLGSATTWGCCVFMLIVLLNRMGDTQTNQ